LGNFSYANAEQDDLWEFLTAAAREDESLDPDLTVKDVMDTWTLQKGYPLVTVTRKNNKIHLTQRYFLLNPLNTIENTPEYAKFQWFVPFTFTTQNELNYDFEERPTWLKPSQTEGDFLFNFLES
jgi:aminopeptidase N